MEELKFNRLTENLIEISQAYLPCLAKHEELAEIDSLDWKQEFVGWANEFEREHPDPGYWEDNDYYEAIENFATEKILEYAVKYR